MERANVIDVDVSQLLCLLREGVFVVFKYGWMMR